MMAALSTTQEITALLRTRPGMAAPAAEWVAFFQRKAALFERLAEHYAGTDPAEAAECRDLAARAAQEAARSASEDRGGGAR